MIIGAGTDICDIRRIARSIDRFGERFINKVFTDAEQQYCEAKSGKASYYAKRFAAKEAVAKALAGENTPSLSWQDVEVVKDPSGRPKVNLYGTAKDRLDQLTGPGVTGRVHLSLSDDYPYAQAFAIAEALV